MRCSRTKLVPINHNEQYRIVAYLDGLPSIGDLRQAKQRAAGATVRGKKELSVLTVKQRKLVI